MITIECMLMAGTWAASTSTLAYAMVTEAPRPLPKKNCREYD
jgi:hypothetical protein